MKKTQLAFIGAGNMARSLIGGLVADGWDPACITVSDPDPDQLAAVTRLFGTARAPDNVTAVGQSELVVLAVKPQIMHDVAKELANTVQTRQPLVISIAAGICTSDLQRWLGGDCALVRCMPNTPALVQSGATAMFANKAVNDDQKALAENIMRAVGLALWVGEEAQMDAVTALSGSGPAYFFLVIEALQEAGTSLGLDDKTARLLALQTAFGATRMALESRDDAATLRQRVTSPGGTTEKALAVLEEGRLRALFSDALKAACDRSRELAKQFGAD
ncbi:Pyrroline-5-carboxylate reductase [hydrothermal vent metagenome]|uniref:Pyrroline-5-carboxylate reductase n=1 Tax=hydrothermal vent metagenome TaxID=652676 RepID=A0A3B0Z058_9ZZZZ